MNLMDLHMFKPQRDINVATFKLFFTFPCSIRAASSGDTKWRVHGLGHHNQVSWSFSFFSPSLPVAYVVLTHLLVVMSNVTDFYQPNLQRQHMHWWWGSFHTFRVPNTPVGTLHTIYDLHHNWISKVSFSGKCQLGLNVWFFLSAARMDKGLASAWLSRMYWI